DGGVDAGRRRRRDLEGDAALVVIRATEQQAHRGAAVQRGIPVAAVEGIDPAPRRAVRGVVAVEVALHQDHLIGGAVGHGGQDVAGAAGVEHPDVRGVATGGIGTVGVAVEVPLSPVGRVGGADVILDGVLPVHVSHVPVGVGVDG